MRARTSLPAALALASLASSGCAAAPPGEEHVIAVTGLTFEPAELTVAVGDTVTWVIDDQGRPHDIVAVDRSFVSGLMEEGEFSHTFAEAGEWDYFCTPHPGMEGAIIVVEP